VKVILEGIVGSQAYGLATEHSDVDRFGIFVSPTKEMLGLEKPKDSIVTTKPDVAYHEVEKFLRLAMKCNPTVLELLFLDNYTTILYEGLMLVANRTAFLSSHAFNAYGQYAREQAKVLGYGAIHNKKFATDKQIRHCFRLLRQGKQLLETGTLTVKVSDRKGLLGLSKLTPKKLIKMFEEEYKDFYATKSVLPDKPNFKLINNVLLNIRNMN
jgi:hypothetical protein